MATFNSLLFWFNSTYKSYSQYLKPVLAALCFPTQECNLFLLLHYLVLSWLGCFLNTNFFYLSLNESSVFCGVCRWLYWFQIFISPFSYKLKYVVFVVFYYTVIKSKWEVSYSFCWLVYVIGGHMERLKYMQLFFNILYEHRIIFRKYLNVQKQIEKQKPLSSQHKCPGDREKISDWR